MTKEIKDLIAEARDRADYMKMLAEARENSPGAAVALEEVDRMTRLADALEATLGEPSEAHDTGMESIDWDMVRDGVGDPEEAASVAVRAALKAAGVVPVQGESKP